MLSTLTEEEQSAVIETEVKTTTLLMNRRLLFAALSGFMALVVCDFQEPVLAVRMEEMGLNVR